MKPVNSPQPRSSFRLLAASSLAVILTASLHAQTPATATAAPAAPAPAPAAAAPAAAAGAITFADVKPLLSKYCYSCHGASAAPTAAGAAGPAKGGLSLDTYANVLKGGRSKKPGITPGKPDNSEIVRRISLTSADKDVMPQKGKPAPTADEVKKIVDWVKAGAPDAPAAPAPAAK